MKTNRSRIALLAVVVLVATAWFATSRLAAQESFPTKSVTIWDLKPKFCKSDAAITARPSQSSLPFSMVSVTAKGCRTIIFRASWPPK